MAHKRIVGVLAAGACAAAGSVAVAQAATTTGGWHHHRHGHHLARLATSGARTPIHHVVVIFQENVSFDHYFGTYPNAANTDGQTFTPAPGTPAVDGLPPATSPTLPPRLRHSTNLLTSNPNEDPPQRLDSSANGLTVAGQGQLTCDQDHNYSDEQQAFDGGAMDHFVQSVGTGGGTGPTGAPCTAQTEMDYYDGNTVTAMWNYAQNYAMSDD